MSALDRKRSISGWLARAFFVTVVVGQLFFIARGSSDPHKHFAWRPFNESDTWRAAIVRVTKDGARIPVEEPWSGYRWSELVRDRGLGYPAAWKHAASGARSIRAFLVEALDWVAAHTPNDNETRYYEATFEWTHNRRGPYRQSFRSQTRSDSLADLGPGRGTH